LKIFSKQIIFVRTDYGELSLFYEKWFIGIGTEISIEELKIQVESFSKRKTWEQRN
jgi:hypothetical protein